MAWRIEYQGATLDESDVTAAHLMMVSELLDGDQSWENTNPMRSPRTLCAWIALVVAQRMQKPLDTVMAFVVSRPLTELVAAVTSIDEATLHAVPDTKAG
jgi:hypothetical protein